MPYVSDISLSVSVHSLELSPDEITKIARVEATRSHCLGMRKGKSRTEKHESNYWSYAIKVLGKDEAADQTHWFSDGLIRLLKDLPVDFVKQLQTRDAEASAVIWVGLFDVQDQGAINIRSDVSKMLGERDLELVFDMYIDHSGDD